MATRMNVAITGIFLLTHGYLATNIVFEFEKFEIVPDVINKAPTLEAQVVYGKKKVEIGEELTRTQVMNAPEIYYKHDDKTFYTLIMIDPDVPSRKNSINGEFVHWLVSNIPGDDISKGDVLSPYIASNPAKGTGLHRYIFLIYNEIGKIIFDEPHLSVTEFRYNFSAQKFTEKYNLGDPIAGNIFQVQWHESSSA